MTDLHESRPGSQVTGPARKDTVVSAWLTDLSFNWKTVTEGTRLLRYAKDDTLFLEGQLADTVFVVETGRVRLASYSLDGRERHLMIIGPNGLVGDCALRASPCYVVSAAAAADASVRALPVDAMQHAIENDPTLLRQFQAFSGLRYRIMLQHLALLGSNSARRRVCHHLIGLMNSYGVIRRDGSLISITFTQLEMGRICGLSRVSVSGVFSMLEREGIISHDGRAVVIRDRAALQHLSTC